VEGVKCQEDLSRVELASEVKLGILFFGEAVLEREESKELSPWAVLQNKVELLVILEALAEANEEGMRDGGEYLLLIHDVLFLVLLEDVLLLEHLHRVDLLVLLAAHQQHLRVRAPPDHRQQAVVLHRPPLHHIM
jgi:hypothetical protein